MGDRGRPRLEVDHELELRGLLDRGDHRRGSLEEAVDTDRDGPSCAPVEKNARTEQRSAGDSGRARAEQAGARKPQRPTAPRRQAAQRARREQQKAGRDHEPPSSATAASQGK
jgi:hypothetical protein